MNRSCVLFCILCLSLLNTFKVEACETIVGRQIIDKLINNQLDQAQRLLFYHSKKKPSDPMSGFYQGTILWAKSGEGHDKKLAQQALDSLKKHIHESQKRSKGAPNNSKLILSSGMSQMLVARIYAGRKQWIAAYKNGKQARLNLQKLSRNNPHEKDALLGLGLFEFYTGSVPPGLRWLTKLMRFTGNKEKGVELIHKAIKESPIFAPEAGRAVVNEIIYSRSDNLCQYLDLSRYLRQRYPNNPQFAFAYQKVLNNCGYAQKALNDNKRASKQFAKYRNIQRRLSRQKLYIFSNLSDIQKIKAFKGKSKRDLYHQNVALGLAYDIKGERKNAIKSYANAKKIAAGRQRLNSKIKYLKTPYKKPSPQPIAAKYPIAKGCG